MAKLLRGIMGGATVKIHQYCNNWFDVVLPDGNPKIVSPLSIELDPEERIMVWDDDSTGNMFLIYRLNLKTGRFTKRRRKYKLDKHFLI